MRFDDYVMRNVRALADAIGKILGLVKAGQNLEAETQVRAAYDTLLGGDAVFLGMVDTATLANLLGTPEKTGMLAKLSLAEARLAEAQGDDARAERLRTRARELAEVVRRELPDFDCGIDGD